MVGIDEPPVRLTPREREVVALIAGGMSAKGIAREMNLSHRTVERHIENIRIKMQARNTAHLIARAFAVGALRSV